ncbi:MAG: hypothetical protein GX197_06830 [Firmicutes bacterium]|nr:hypothetical protein [Bacillota bacterium]
MKDPISRFPLFCLLGIIAVSVFAHALRNIAAPLLPAINIFSGPVWNTLKVGLIVGLIGTVLIFFAILYLMSIAPTQQVKQNSTQRYDYPYPYAYGQREPLTQAQYYILQYKQRAANKPRQQQTGKTPVKKAKIIQFPQK